MAEGKCKCTAAHILLVFLMKREARINQKKMRLKNILSFKNLSDFQKFAIDFLEGKPQN